MKAEFLKPKCYVIIAYAPKSTTIHDADLAFNRLLENRGIGMPLYHDHFVGVPGGFGIFYIESAIQLNDLANSAELRGWEVKVHPLTFTETPIEMLYQMDFTTAMYRGRRLRELALSYRESVYEKSIDGHVGQSVSDAGTQ